MRRRSVFTVAILALGLISQPAAAASLTANQLLEKISVAEESNITTYKREFFKHWIDQDKDTCDTREEVLLQESISAAKRGSGCKIVKGKWLSQYDKKSFTTPTGLDIDHMVPLKEAWESGAFGWTTGQRQAFANDLGFQGSLIAVSAATNRSKSDKDPATWLPKNSAFTCTYVVTWLQVKYRWSLTIDPKEKSSIKSVLERCPTSKLFSLPKQAVRTPNLPVPESPQIDSSDAVTPTASPEIGLDQRFNSCSAAKAYGYGPYVRGIDPEYDWYRDGDSDGTVCE